LAIGPGGFALVEVAKSFCVFLFGFASLEVCVENRGMRRRSSKNRNDTMTGLSPAEERKRTFDRAVKLLAAKPRSVAELRERLIRGRGANKATVDEVISRLSEYGYLDDERFAFSYASLKVKQRPIGRRRLAQDLKMKKVQSSVADEALELVYSETSEEDLIDRAIEKRLRIRGRPKNRMEAKSLFDHLLRQGFEYELVSEKVRGLVTNESDDFE